MGKAVGEYIVYNDHIIGNGVIYQYKEIKEVYEVNKKGILYEAIDKDGIRGVYYNGERLPLTIRYLKGCRVRGNKVIVNNWDDWCCINLDTKQIVWAFHSKAGLLVVGNVIKYIDLPYRNIGDVWVDELNRYLIVCDGDDNKWAVVVKDKVVYGEGRIQVCDGIYNILAVSESKIIDVEGNEYSITDVVSDELYMAKCCVSKSGRYVVKYPIKVEEKKREKVVFYNGKEFTGKWVVRLEATTNRTGAVVSLGNEYIVVIDGEVVARDKNALVLLANPQRDEFIIGYEIQWQEPEGWVNMVV